VVIQNDSIRHEAYWDGYGPESRSNSFSVAKSIVSTLVGIALKDGLIRSIDQPVGDFLPEFKEGEKQKITIRHLLMMSSGLNWEESYSNPLSMTTEAYYGHDLRKLIGRLEVAEAPGKRWQYLSGDTQVLSFVLEAATGKSLSDYASERLWKRVGAEQDAEWSIDREDGVEKAYCCVFSNARDFARLGQLYLNQGVWKGDTILSAAYVKQATTPHGLPDVEGKPSNWYGLQWWILPAETGVKGYYARGILGQYVIVVPEKKLVMVRLGKKRGEKIGNHFEELIELTRTVAAQY
jgi:CubicO group peptidase (beta-lactamase class C family)